MVIDSSKDPYGDAHVTNQNRFIDAVDSAGFLGKHNHDDFSFWEPNPSAIEHKMEEVVRVKAREAAIVKAGMSEVLSKLSQMRKIRFNGLLDPTPKLNSST